MGSNNLPPTKTKLIQKTTTKVFIAVRDNDKIAVITPLQ